MIELLDIGNTRLKRAYYDDSLHVDAVVVHHDDPLACYRQLPARAVTSLWISAVPRLADPERWRSALHASRGVIPQFAQSCAEWCGWRSAYAQPQKLGVDRWLAMLALWHESRTPFCVVSAGTALTADRVDASGQHLGGMIAQGLGTMQRALLNVTRTDSNTDAQTFNTDLGRDSQAAIRQGAFFAAVGAVEQVLRAPGAAADRRRVITGGDASALLPALGAGWQHRPHLVLEGLLALALSES